MRSRLPLILGISLGLHLLAAVALMSVPGRELVRKIMPIVLVERHKPKPEKPKEPPKPRPKKAALKKATPKLAPHPARPRPLAPAAGDAPANFGVGEGPGGTMEVPVGESLEVEATASAPLELAFSDDATVEVLEREPEPIGRLRVNYPEVARVAGATGSALVQAWVEADGRVGEAKVLSYSGGIAFARAAEEAVRQTRFKPALRDGVAVSCSVKVPIAFSLAEVSHDSP